MTTVRVRVNRDVVGNVLRDGETLHTNARIMRHIDGRVAVFPDKASPPIVYEPDTVQFTPLRTPCSCKGDAAKNKLLMIWQQAENVPA